MYFKVLILNEKQAPKFSDVGKGKGYVQSLPEWQHKLGKTKLNCLMEIESVKLFNISTTDINVTFCQMI